MCLVDNLRFGEFCSQSYRLFLNKRASSCRKKYHTQIKCQRHKSCSFRIHYLNIINSSRLPLLSTRKHLLVIRLLTYTIIYIYNSYSGYEFIQNWILLNICPSLAIWTVKHEGMLVCCRETWIPGSISNFHPINLYIISLFAITRAGVSFKTLSKLCFFVFLWKAFQTWRFNDKKSLTKNVLDGFTIFNQFWKEDTTMLSATECSTPDAFILC